MERPDSTKCSGSSCLHRGGATRRLVDRIMSSRPHPQQGFRSALGIMRLGKIYGPERLEAAAERALRFGDLFPQNWSRYIERNRDGLCISGGQEASFFRLDYPPHSSSTTLCATSINVSIGDGRNPSPCRRRIGSCNVIACDGTNWERTRGTI
jgi:hypothetical protein